MEEKRRNEDTARKLQISRRGMNWRDSFHERDRAWPDSGIIHVWAKQPKIYHLHTHFYTTFIYNYGRNIQLPYKKMLSYIIWLKHNLYIICIENMRVEKMREAKLNGLKM